MTHIRISELTIISSDNGLAPDRRQAIIWNNARKLLIGSLGTNFSEILVKIYTFSLKKMHLKMSGKWQPSYISLNVLNKFGMWMIKILKIYKFSRLLIHWGLITHQYVSDLAWYLPHAQMPTYL